MTDTPRIRPVRAARGSALTCRGWPQEAALRMLMNTLDPEVTGRPGEPVAVDAIVRYLTDLGDDETLLVRSGTPAGVLRTHEWAPRVLAAHSDRNVGAGVGAWIGGDGQDALAAGYETFGAVARSLDRRSLAGTITVTAGLGRVGGALPAAVTMYGGVVIGVEVDPARIARRLAAGCLDVSTADAAEALTLAIAARDENRPRSIGLLGNAAEELPRLLAAGAPVDIVTDRTTAHDPLRYLPIGVRVTDRRRLAEQDPARFTELVRASTVRHVAAMAGFRDAGAAVFEYGNSIRDRAHEGGYPRAFAFPEVVSAYLRPLFEEGRGPLRVVALSGDPADLAAADRAIGGLFPDDEHLHRWITLSGRRAPGAGLPARICWLDPVQRRRVGLRLNEMVGAGEVSAPIVLGSGHLDAGSAGDDEVAADGSGAAGDRPLLDALATAAAGASWVSVRHGGVDRVCVADGTDVAAARIDRVLPLGPAAIG